MKPLKIQEIRNRINTLIHNSALEAWSWYEWLFFYGFIPAVLTLVPLLPQMLQSSGIPQTPPNDILNLTFILDIYHPTIPAMFLMNYTHTDLIHFASNFFFYIFVITMIFIIERNKKRFFTLTTVFLLVLPIFISIVSILFLRGVPAQIPPSLGFSGILYAFFGSAIYLIFSLFHDAYLNINEAWKIADTEKKFRIAYGILVINMGFLILIFLFGILIGSFFNSQGIGIGNGIAHFFGFVCGLICPLLYTSIEKQKVNLVDQTLLIYLFFTIVLYSLYLMRLHD
jgi:membrane associated rhomboid family serine protease